jgi:hypothetical protein
MKADRDAADDALAARAALFLGHLYLTLLPGGPILVPPILAAGQSTAVAYFAEL